MNEQQMREFKDDLRESLKIEAEQHRQGRDPYEPTATEADMARAHSLLEALEQEELEYTFGPIEDDMVHHPSHYKSAGMEAIEVMEAFVPDFHSYCMGNVIKYVLRHLQKNGKQDLEKARWYLDRMIKDY